MRNIELAVRGEGGGVGLGFEAAIQRLQSDFSEIHVLFTLHTEPEPSFKVKQDVLKGAEGMWYLWYAVNDDKLHFSGRGLTQRKRNAKFINLGCAEGKFVQSNGAPAVAEQE